MKVHVIPKIFFFFLCILWLMLVLINCGRVVTTSTRQIYSAISTNGLVFTQEAGLRIASGSVPDVVQLSDGTFYMYYVVPGDDNVLFASSSDGLNFENIQTVLSKGGSFDVYGAVDPAVIKLSDTNFRMYYVGWVFASAVSQRTVNNLVYANSSDGLTWIKVCVVTTYEGLSDVTGIATGENYRLYFSDKDNLYTLLVSSDGFTVIGSTEMISLPLGCTVPHILDTGSNYRLYFNHSPRYDSGPKYVLYSATTTDLLTFVTDEASRYSNADAASVIKLSDGRYRLYYQIGTD